MTKRMRATDVLDYYDGVQLFEGADDHGGRYVGVRVDAEGERDLYAVVGASTASLERFRAGELDLRGLMLAAPEWFLTKADAPFGEPMALSPQARPLSATDYLPLPGLTPPGAPVSAARGTG